MLALMQKCGLCLQYVDEETVQRNARAAGMQNIDALLTYLSNSDNGTLFDVLNDKHYVVAPLRNYSFQFGPMPIAAAWQLYGASPGNDAVRPSVSGAVIYPPEAKSFPEKVSREVFVSSYRGLSRTCLVSEEPPHPLQIVDEPKEVQRELRKFPHLAGERTFWINNLMESVYMEGNDLLFFLIQEFMSLELRGDRDLMLLACKKEWAVHRLLDVTLQSDWEILTAVLVHEYYMHFRDDAVFFWLPL